MREIVEFYFDLEIDTLIGSIWLFCFGCSFLNSRGAILWILYFLFIFVFNMLFYFICLFKEGVNSICIKVLVNELIMFK